jgi:hypothetical protein
VPSKITNLTGIIGEGNRVFMTDVVIRNRKIIQVKVLLKIYAINNHL